MIRVLERKRKYIKLSIHRMFLEASTNILDAVGDFILNQKNRLSSTLLQDYITKSLSQIDYSDKLNISKLETLGNVYDLKMIYHDLNEKYFNNKLKLQITWFGKSRLRRSSQITFGLYHEPLKLVKISRILDKRGCPDYFIEYVVYHEMLHEIYRPYRSSKGTFHIHTKEFKEEEKKFEHFKKAKAWEKKFKNSSY